MSTTRHPNAAGALHARAHSDSGNDLLAALSAPALALLTGHLHRHEFSKGSVLWAAGATVDHVYFPHSGLISIAIPGQGGRRLEVGSVSREGAVGNCDGAADARPIASGVVQIAGRISIIPARQFRDAVRQSEEIAALAAYACEWQLMQAQIMAACNATHSADARFSRWLLLASQRSGSDILAVTQEEVASILGIRRTTVTLIAQKLQQAGAIQYSRGKVVVRDHVALKAAACACWPLLGSDHWPSTRLRGRQPPADQQRAPTD